MLTWNPAACFECLKSFYIRYISVNQWKQSWIHSRNKVMIKIPIFDYHIQLPLSFSYQSSMYADVKLLSMYSSSEYEPFTQLLYVIYIHLNFRCSWLHDPLKLARETPHWPTTRGCRTHQHLAYGIQGTASSEMSAHIRHMAATSLHSKLHPQKIEQFTWSVTLEPARPSRRVRNEADGT